MLNDEEASPKEEALLALCCAECKLGRRVLVYTIYTGTRDTTPRLKRLLETAGFKTAVLWARVGASPSRGWIFEQEDRGIEVLITHLGLVHTGLDLLSWPTMVFLQGGTPCTLCSKRHDGPGR